MLSHLLSASGLTAVCWKANLLPVSLIATCCQFPLLLPAANPFSVVAAFLCSPTSEVPYLDSLPYWKIEDCYWIIEIALSETGMLHTYAFPRRLLTISTEKSLKTSIKKIKCALIQFEMYKTELVARRGALIVLEGLDRCGKTTQCGRLVSFLEGRGLSVEALRFPDRDTAIGRMISSYLTNNTHLDDQTVHLLFSANRWEKRLLMENKLKNGTTLVVDRYSYSGVSFSAAKGLDIEWCKAPEKGLIAPDLVIYLDVLPEEAAKRGSYGTERYEQLEFQKNVARCYQILHDASWKVIDASPSLELIENQIKELALESIESCQNKSLSNLWLND